MLSTVDRAVWLGIEPFYREGYACARTDIGVSGTEMIVRGIIQIANTATSAGILVIPTLLNVSEKDSHLVKAGTWNAEHLREIRGVEYQVRDLLIDMGLSRDIHHPYRASIGKCGPDSGSMDVVYITHGRRADTCPTMDSITWAGNANVLAIIGFITGLQESYSQLNCTPEYSRTGPFYDGNKS